MIIRKKEEKDIEAWIDVNINSWNENLKGVVSDNLLKMMRDKRKTRIEKNKEEWKEDDWHYVLEENNKVIGIMKLRECDKKGYENCGEVQILYLYKAEKGKGYGKALLEKGFEVLKSKGYDTVIIGCLEGNPSNGFYKHMGAELVNERVITIGEQNLPENIYYKKI